MSEIKDKAVSGAVWTAVEKFTRQAVQFVIGIILARLLAPEDFGAIGMLAIFISIAQTFTDSGLSSALIQKQDRTDTDCSTLFYFNIVVASLLYIILFFTAPWIAAFYRMPILTDVTRVVSLSLVIAALTMVHNTILTIELRFKTISIISIVSMITTGITGLVLAFCGWGVWALVFQSLVGQIVTSTCIWYYCRWSPKMTFSIKSFKLLWDYGSKLLGASIINTIYANLYTLVIGRKFSSSDVGFYNRGNQFAMLPTQTVQDMAIKVNFPLLVKMQDDNERMLGAYKKLLTAPLYILYPILVGMAVLADPLIRVLIGEKWLPCVPIMQVLCIGYIFSPLTHVNLNLLYVKGRTDLVLKLELIKKPIAFLILIATLPFGIIVMVLGKALYEFIAFSFNCYYTGKLLHYGEWQQIKALMPIILNCIIMAIVIRLSMSLCDSQVVKLGLGILVGILSYIAFSVLSRDKTFFELKSIVVSKLKINNEK